MKKGRLIVISGPSGVGKSSLRERLFAYKEYNLAYSISMTTRYKRVNEVEGKDYYFVTPERFKEAIANGELLEHAQFVNNYYGTPKVALDKMLESGKNVLLEIEIQGANQVLNLRKDTLSIFLIPPSIDVLESRIKYRNTEDIDTLKKRVEIADIELKQRDKYDYVIVNDDIEKALSEIKEIFDRELGGQND